MYRLPKWMSLGLASTAIVVVAAACGGDDDDGDASQATTSPPNTSVATSPAGSPEAGTPETPESTGAGGAPASTIDFAAPSGINGGDDEFNYSALVWQGYWLSRDHFGPFVMGSGLGIPFEPPMDMLQAGMQMIAGNPNDPVMIPANMAPLQAVFASARSTLLNDPMDYEPLDFEGLRLDPTTFDETVQVRAQAETMLKESQWAHNFADAHFGAPGGDFGAQQRFMGLMVNMLAQMQGQYAMQNLLGDDGLYHDSDGTLDYTGNWVMLHVLSDLAGLAGDEGGRYANPDMAGMFDMAASNLMAALEDREPETPQESAAAIRALHYRAFTASDAAIEDAAQARAETITDGLIGLDSDNVAENSAAIAGLVAQATVSDDGSYRDAADDLFETLTDDFDATNGVFESKDTYSVEDVAWIIGGLNSLTQQGNDATKGPASRMLVAFYESTISVAGLQLSAPPGNDGAMAGAFEKELPSVVYYHPANTPAPPQAGELMVPGEEITWDGTSWTLTSDRFVTAGAMHLANELNWLGPHLGSIPFPFQETAATPQDPPAPAPTTAAGPPSTDVKLTAQNITFSTTTLEVAAGQDVTITYDNQDDAVTHNLHFQAGAAGDFKTEIVAGPTQQTLTFNISEPGAYAFVCDVHPAQMMGALVVK